MNEQKVNSDLTKEEKALIMERLKDYPIPRNGICYANAQRLCRDFDDVIYCEGFIIEHGFLSPHGWNIFNNKILELTPCFKKFKIGDYLESKRYSRKQVWNWLTQTPNFERITKDRSIQEKLARCGKFSIRLGW